MSFYISNFEKDKNLKNINRNFSVFSFLKLFFIFLLIFFIGFYVVLEVKNRYSKPDLFVFSPSDNYSASSSEVVIFGKTLKDVNLKINGEYVLLKNDGTFNKNIILNNGLNVIKISASKKDGLENVVTKRIIFENNKVSVR